MSDMGIRGIKMSENNDEYTRLRKVVRTAKRASGLFHPRRLRAVRVIPQKPRKRRR